MMLPAIHAFIDSPVLSCIHAPYFASCFCNVGAVLFVDLFVVVLCFVNFYVAVIVVCFCTVGAGTRVGSSLTYAPAALATCSDLRSLANVGGTIPPEIGQITNLTWL